MVAQPLGELALRGMNERTRTGIVNGRGARCEMGALRLALFLFGDGDGDLARRAGLSGRVYRERAAGKVLRLTQGELRGEMLGERGARDPEACQEDGKDAA